MRELALREVAEDVEQRRGTDRPRALEQAAVNERVLALVSRSRSRSDHAASVALGSATQGEMDALWVQAGRNNSQRPRRRSSPPATTGARSSASDFLEEEADARPTVRRVARPWLDYVFVGTPDERRRREILHGSLVSALVRELPGVDIRVVANRAERRELSS